MAPEDIKEPSLNELCTLNVLGILAYAARCARRMQPRFKLPPDEPDGAEITAAVDEAIRWAEVYIHTGSGELERGQWLADTMAAIAEATYEFTDFSAFAAQHAVRRAHDPRPAAGGDAVDRGLHGGRRRRLRGKPRRHCQHAVVDPSVGHAAQLAGRLRQAPGTHAGDGSRSAANGSIRRRPYPSLGDLWQGKTPTW